MAKTYITPSVSYVGPDVVECLETNTPMAQAVLSSVTTTVAANAATVVARAW